MDGMQRLEAILDIIDEKNEIVLGFWERVEQKKLNIFLDERFVDDDQKADADSTLFEFFAKFIELASDADYDFGEFNDLYEKIPEIEPIYGESKFDMWYDQLNGIVNNATRMASDYTSRLVKNLNEVNKQKNGTNLMRILESEDVQEQIRGNIFQDYEQAHKFFYLMIEGLYRAEVLVANMDKTVNFYEHLEKGETITNAKEMARDAYKDSIYNIDKIFRPLRISLHHHRTQHYISKLKQDLKHNDSKNKN